MSYQESVFRSKFADAAPYLDALPDQMVSHKLKENMSGHDVRPEEYHELLRVLEQEAHVRSVPIQGNFQGKAHLVENAKTKVIIVEHESGLEILYIAGSIASLIGLIPLILQCWSRVRNHGSRHHTPDSYRIETRFNNQGHLVEVPIDRFDIIDGPLFSIAETVDTEIRQLKATLMDLTKRVEIIEQGFARKTRSRKAPSRKSATKTRRNS